MRDMAGGEGEGTGRVVVGLVEEDSDTEAGEVGAAEAGTMKAGVVQVGTMAVKEQRRLTCLAQGQHTNSGTQATQEGGGRDQCWRMSQHTLQVSSFVHA
jgi:hypothetical protein